MGSRLPWSQEGSCSISTSCAHRWSFGIWLHSNFNAHSRPYPARYRFRYDHLPGPSLHDRGSTRSSSRSTICFDSSRICWRLYDVSYTNVQLNTQENLSMDRNALVNIGTNASKNLTLQWRMPLALACVGPVILLAGLSFIPGTFPTDSLCFTF